MGSEFEDEFFEAASSNIKLKTNSTKCKVCKSGDVLPETKTNKSKDKFIIYTRNGTLRGTHITYR